MASVLRIDSEVVAEFSSLLDGSESLIWADKPRRLAFTLMERFHVGLCLLFAVIGFSILIIAISSDSGGPYIIETNGEPTDVGKRDYYAFLSIFAAAGLFFVGFAVITAKLRTGSYYAMSKTRILIRYPSLFGRRDTSLFIERLAGVERLGGSEIGTLILLSDKKRPHFLNPPSHILPQPPVLSGIFKPEAVEQFIVSRIGQGATP